MAGRPGSAMKHIVMGGRWTSAPGWPPPYGQHAAPGASKYPASTRCQPSWRHSRGCWAQLLRPVLRQHAGCPKAASGRFQGPGLLGQRDAQRSKTFCQDFMSAPDLSLQGAGIELTGHQKVHGGPAAIERATSRPQASGAARSHGYGCCCNAPGLSWALERSAGRCQGRRSRPGTSSCASCWQTAPPSTSRTCSPQSRNPSAPPSSPAPAPRVFRGQAHWGALKGQHGSGLRALTSGPRACSLQSREAQPGHPHLHALTGVWACSLNWVHAAQVACLQTGCGRAGRRTVLY